MQTTHRQMIGVALWAMLTMLAAMAGCSDDDDTNQQQPDGSPVLDGSAVDATLPDVEIFPDLGLLPDIGVTEPCESEWKDAINPQETVSAGAVTTEDQGNGIFKTTIDATAGGMNEAHNNPFVYISLADGSKVEIDDMAARDSTAWDLGFRRTVIRVNGGDSGAGQGAVSILVGQTLDQVTGVPEQSTFATDDFLDDNCQVKTNPIGSINTAFGGVDGMWYEFDTGSMQVNPKPDTYVVRRADGSHVKLYIDSYYSSTTPAEGANFTISWSAL